MTKMPGQFLISGQFENFQEYQVSGQLGPLHSTPCSSMGMRRGTDRQTHRQMAVAIMHFASAMPHTKCSYYNNK